MANPLRCSGFDCKGKPVAIVTIKTPRMPAPGFYPTCAACLDKRPLGVGPYITSIRTLD